MKSTGKPPADWLVAFTLNDRTRGKVFFSVHKSRVRAEASAHTDKDYDYPYVMKIDEFVDWAMVNEVTISWTGRWIEV